MTVPYSPYYISNITSKPEPPHRMKFLYSPYDFWKISSKPEWYLEKTTPPDDNFLFTSWYLKNNLKIRMILRKYPPLRMKVHYSPYYIWKKNLKNQMILRKEPPLRMRFLCSPYDFWKITSISEWYLENNLSSEWQFPIHIDRKSVV